MTSDTQAKSRQDAVLKRKLLGTIARYWRGQLLATILIGIAVLGDLAIPLLLKQVIDVAAPAKDLALLSRYILYMAAAFGLSHSAQYWGEIVYSMNGLRAQLDMRQKIFSTIPRLEFSFLKALRAGDVVNRCTGDAEAVSAAISELLPFLILNILNAIGLVVVMLVLQPVLAIVTFATIILSFGILAAFGRKVQELSVAERTKLGEVASLVAEAFSNVRAVKTNNAYDWVERRFDGVQAQFKALKLRQVRLLKLQTVLSRATAASSVFWAVGLGGYMVIQSHFTVGALVSFLMYSSRLISPLQAILQFGAVMSGMWGSIKRVFEVFDFPTEPVGGSGVQDIRRIEFDNVAFSYDGQERLLKNVSFALEPGELTVLVGDIGSGKSTIVNLLLGLQKPASGRILVNGADLSHLDIAEFRNRIGYVEQDVHVFSCSVRENILLGRNIKSENLSRFDDIIARAFKGLPNDLDTVVGENGVALSGGQKQILGILRALVHDPAVILMDEPTSSIDPETEKMVHELLALAKRDRIMLLIAHRESTMQVADKVLRLEQGEVHQTEMGA